MDVRVLRLKRWYLPQAKSIAEIDKDDISKYGQYISFHNFHFWDVLATDDNDIKSAYRAIRKSRKEHKDSEIHVIQSMVLVGESNTFWENKGTTMYATMLQFANVADLDHDELRDRIKNSFDKNGISEDNWCMYYSLDFCDAVIFAKDVPLKVYQESLWDMSLCTPSVSCRSQANDARRYIRDTVTVYGISSDHVLEKFSQYSKGELPDTHKEGSENFGISVELSLQSVSTWNSFKVKTNATDSSIKNSLGRYDVQLVYKDVNIDAMLYIAYCLHEPGISSARDAFCEYKIVPFVEPFDVSPGADIALHSDFVEVAERALDKLLSKQTLEAVYGSEFPDDGSDETSIEASIMEYGMEFKRGIIALLKQSFSEEFAISILRSFIGYLNLINEELEYGNITKQSTDENGKDKYDKFITFQREYFQGVSMLIHCTMHSEKQFIQAPSFNSVICDVPPKLLAFYSGIAYAASEVLNDKDTNKFSFLFVPDFRRDIYVKPISSTAEAKQFIYIINLNEKFFYDPKTAIPLVCHEVAHYVGSDDRKREERAEELFTCLSAYLIYSVLPTDFNDEADELVDTLALCLAKEALKKYEEKFDEEHNGTSVDAEGIERYYLADIEKFVRDSSGFFTILLMPKFRQSVISKWQDIKASDTVRQLAEKIDNRLHSSYLTLFLGSDNSQIALETIMTKLFDEIVLKFRNQNGWKLTCCKFFNNIAACFSEAYADLKMYEILSKSSDGGMPYLVHYEKLPKDLMKTAASDEIDYSYYCRRAPVYESLGIDVPDGPASEIADPVSISTIRYVQKKVVCYLERCRRRSYDPQKEPMRMNIVRAFENLGIDDAEKQFGEIRTTIMEYRNNLEGYCRSIANDTANKADTEG